MKHFFAGETFFIQFFCLVLYPILGVMFMKMHVLRYFSLVMIFLLISCSKDASLRQLEQIKAIGDNDPKKALSMLDSLEIEVRGEGDYVKSKYDLLRIRLNDKAYIMPTSDIMIKKLVTYFKDKGTDAEKQEVYHYAGSVYRDLQDTPRALEHFFKALDYANANPKECDSVMLSNTYSNINDLQYKVQNYNESLKAAFKELEIDRKTKRDLTISFSHVGTSQKALGHDEEAEAAFDSVYACIVRSKTEDENQDMLMLLLLLLVLLLLSFDLLLLLRFLSHHYNMFLLLLYNILSLLLLLLNILVINYMLYLLLLLLLHFVHSLCLFHLLLSFHPSLMMLLSLLHNALLHHMLHYSLFLLLLVFPLLRLHLLFCYLLHYSLFLLLLLMLL